MAGTVQLRSLLESRLLIRHLLAQDIKLKYRHSVLGVVWALLNPLLMLLVLTVAFTFVFDRKYPLHLFATLLPWQFFSAALTDACRSIQTSRSTILNWNIPRIVFPLRKVLLHFFEYLLALVALFSLAWLVGFRPSLALAVLPLSMLVLFLATFGLSLAASIVSLYFRDVQHLVGVALRAWFYLTPIIIPFEHLPEAYQKFVALNPAYYWVEMFDAPITRGEFPDPQVCALACATALACCVLGFAVFTRYDNDAVFRL